MHQDQQELIQRIFDSLHSSEYLADVKKQVRIDQYGQAIGHYEQALQVLREAAPVPARLSTLAQVVSSTPA